MKSTSGGDRTADRGTSAHIRPAAAHPMRPDEDDEAVARSLRPRGPARLRITETEQDGRVILEITGELDVLTGSKLTSTLDELVRRGAGDLCLDLRGASFIDSFALYVLLQAQRRLARQQRGFNVICGRGPVRHAIELAKLSETLGVIPPARSRDSLLGSA